MSQSDEIMLDIEDALEEAESELDSDEYKDLLYDAVNLINDRLAKMED